VVPTLLNIGYAERDIRHPSLVLRMDPTSSTAANRLRPSTTVQPPLGFVSDLTSAISRCCAILYIHSSSFLLYTIPYVFFSDSFTTIRRTALHSVLVPCILRINTVLLYTPTSTIDNTTPIGIFDVLSLFESQVQDQETEYSVSSASR